MPDKSLIVIVGPTAVGKTAISVELAKKLSCAVISADSRQLFKEMQIGTAKPTTEEMDGVKHYFINDRSIEEEFSAGRFEHEALQVIEEEFASKDVCMVVGGSGLYVDAVTKGLDHFPEVDSNIREKLNNELETKGLEPLQEQLKTLEINNYLLYVERKKPQNFLRFFSYLFILIG